MAIKAHTTQFMKKAPIEPTSLKIDPGVMKIPEPMMVVPIRAIMVERPKVGFSLNWGLSDIFILFFCVCLL